MEMGGKLNGEPLPEDPRFNNPHFEDETYPTASYETRLALRENRAVFNSFIEWSDRTGIGCMEPRTKEQKAFLAEWQKQDAAARREEREQNRALALAVKIRKERH